MASKRTPTPRYQPTRRNLADRRDRPERSSQPERRGQPERSSQPSRYEQPARPGQLEQRSQPARRNQPEQRSPSARRSQPTRANQAARRNSSFNSSNRNSSRSGKAGAVTSITNAAPWLRIAGITAAALAVVAVVGAFIVPAIGGISTPGDNQNATAPATTVSLLAVGDNLPDDHIGWYADGRAGEMDDGLYDYSPVYAPIARYVQEADLAYIDQETHLGGDDIGPQGYPSFNAMDSMATAVVDTGFDLVASASNHAYDWGQDALAHSVALWESKPVAFTGTSVTEEQYNRIPVVEKNGITFALLNYTYGVNYDLDQLPAHTINLIDDERITADVTRAHELADVVLVAMHWGTELLTEADEEQLRVAQLLADLNVDVVLGSHPHVIGPMEWVANSKDPNHRTLVAYSLGNFLADHESPQAVNVLEGMMTCDFIREEAGGAVAVDNVRWIPLICHSSQARDNFAVFALDDYPTELAKQCRALSEIDNPKQWLHDETVRIVGEQWF